MSAPLELPRRSLLPGWFTPVLVAALLGLAGLLVVANWSEYSELLRTGDARAWSVAIAAVVAGTICNVAVAFDATRVDHPGITYRAIYRMSVIAALARFLPGGVWQVGAQYGLGTDEGLRFRQSMLAWIEPTAFNVLIGGAMAATAAASVGYAIPAWLFLAAAVGLVGLSFHPARALVYRSIRLIRESANLGGFGTWARRSALTAGAVLALAVHGMAVTRALGIENPPGLTGSMAAFVGAWIVGLLAIPLPGGLGVREGALIFALSPWMGATEALLVAFASRVVSVLADVISAAVGLVLKYAFHG